MFSGWGDNRGSSLTHSVFPPPATPINYLILYCLNRGRVLVRKITALGNVKCAKREKERDKAQLDVRVKIVCSD